ncbi:MAG TPA: glyceraldehyde-3-phosphate dehydrogenase [Cytophagales bacterium]|nr:glyceraldehyde-3-phosphate dehydrogenase [Cytophagales bacterium]HCR54103.1 glyceraldehyde-3-phosphate dehydrogenase [Cytophagales bacterium]
MNTKVAENGTASGYELELSKWINQEMAAISLISSIGTLFYDRSIELMLFKNRLVDQSVSGILSLHKYAKDVVNKPINIFDSAELAKLVVEGNYMPSRIDIGKLTYEWQEEQSQYSNKQDFIRKKLTRFENNGDHNLVPRDVILFGFGRIGRLVARELVQNAGKGQQLRLRAIVSRGNSDENIIKRAALLRTDSVHGPFRGTIVEDLENKTLKINGQIVHMIEADNIESIDYESYGITNALVIDNSGAFRDRESLGKHLKAKGVGKVLLTAPGKDFPNIVYGVNHDELDLDKENIFSAASCTTNAIVPVLKVINDKLGIEKGHIETVHAYTNDQNLLDNMHKKNRRGRSAAINMVITETGAGKAVTKVIPNLKDKLTANAVRVPTPNGSLAIMNLSVGRETSLEEVNSLIKDAALNGKLVSQIFYSINQELVSNDIIGNSCCSVFDSPATIIHPDKKNIVLYVWYDNEYGYTRQVIRLAKHVAKVRRMTYY